MKRTLLAIIFACCTLTLTAQEAIRVNYKGASPTISDLAWAYLSSEDNEDEEEGCMDESSMQSSKRGSSIAKAFLWTRRTSSPSTRKTATCSMSGHPRRIS